MPPPALTSVDLHLRFPAEAVVETDALEDSACGIYPCYYRRLPDRLRVSTSALALIADAGTLEINPSFRPREYLLGDNVHARFVRGTAALPYGLKEWVKRVLPIAMLHHLARNRFWYESWDTMDVRVRKLRPFERVTPTESTDTFAPDFSLRSSNALMEGVCAHLVRFVRSIEAAFPNHDHVMMIGGKDSQILALIPKAQPERWHVFSAAPNCALVHQWLAWNGVKTGQVFGHDNRNEETKEATERKIVCSDLYSDPRHMRWLPALKRIADAFEGRCIFWSGSAGDALHVGRPHHRRYQHANPRGFFDIHLTRVPCLVGNYHQVVKNFTGCPLLCPYHSAELWHNVYLHHGPAVIPTGTDLRPRIGERLAGRPIRWLEKNPWPEPYRYDRPFHARQICLRHLQQRLRESAP